MTGTDLIMHSDDQDFGDKISKILMGRKIIRVDALNEREATLTLDNGIELWVEGNEGCGGCGNGWYDVTHLEVCDNAITNVVCEDDEETYNIFVFCEDKKINCLQVEGYDNGYYGTGYSLTVKHTML